MFLRHRLCRAVLVLSGLAPGACGPLDICTAVRMAPFTAVGVDSRGPFTPFEPFTALGVARWNLALAVFAIEAFHPKTLSKRNFGPFLIPVTEIQLKFAFPNSTGDEIYLFVFQRHATEGFECSSISLGQQTAMSGAVHLDTSCLVQSPGSFEGFQDSQIEDASEVFVVFLLREDLCTDR